MGRVEARAAVNTCWQGALFLLRNACASRMAVDIVLVADAMGLARSRVLPVRFLNIAFVKHLQDPIVSIGVNLFHFRLIVATWFCLCWGFPSFWFNVLLLGVLIGLLGISLRT